jgi:hypothetical protein
VRMGEVSGRRGAQGVAEWAETMEGARSTAAGLTGHGGRGISFTIYRPPRPVSPTTHGSIIRRRFRPFPDPGELASFTTPASCEGGDAMARDMHDPRGGRRATKAVSARCDALLALVGSFLPYRSVRAFQTTGAPRPRASRRRHLQLCSVIGRARSHASTLS